MLYPKQQIIVNKLNQAYARKLPITENHYFLSGEMGVGKTYMGAQLAIDHADHGVMIVVPDVVSTKWVKVLSEITSPNNITLVDNHFCKTSELNFSPNHITVIPNQYFNRLFNTDELKTVMEKWYEVKDPSVETINEWVKNEQNVKYQRALNYIHYQLEHVFFIYDEIHQARNSKLDCINALFHPETTFVYYMRKINPHWDDKDNESNPQYSPRNPALFLTGTIFNVDSYALADLLRVTNVKLLRYQSINIKETIKTITIFLAKIWRYISVSIALADIQKDSNDNIHQTVLPIKSIQLSSIEHAFYNLVTAQLEANSNTNSGVSKRKHRLYASNLLDYPERKPIMENKSSRRKDMYLRYDQNVLLSLPLKDMKLTNTKKYQTLLKYLKKYKDKSTVIYATDYKLIHQLVNELNQIGYHVTTLPKSIKANQYSDYMNNALANHQMVIVNPKDVTVGVDINAELLIWYQLLTDMTSIIQAQRRVYRLSSTHDSDVLFLPYSLTYQEDLVDDISNSAKNNAASYGIQDRSELAKKTNILLASLNQ